MKVALLIKECVRRFRRFLVLLVLGMSIAMASVAQAQETFPETLQPILEKPRVPLKLFGPDGGGGSGAPSQTPRLALLGMQAGFLTNPLGIDPDEDLAPGYADETGRGKEGDLDFLQFTFGTYNPYLDLRRPGDPGGVGYYRIYSQLQLFDAGKTSVCVALNAYTPAGLEAGGVANGPSHVVPGLACFHDLGSGTAFQGYVGQNIQANSRWTERMNSGFHCGMAIQHPVPGTTPTADQGLFLFFEALGRYRFDTGTGRTTDGRTVLWEFVPGVQMRLNSNCWMSLGASRYNFLSCFWRY
jgi:hypothetical protein